MAGSSGPTRKSIPNETSSVVPQTFSTSRSSESETLHEIRSAGIAAIFRKGKDYLEGTITYTKYDESERVFDIAAIGTLGVEWRIHKVLALFAEYQADLTLYSSYKAEANDSTNAGPSIFNGEAKESHFLNLSIDYLGYVLDDTRVTDAVRRQKAVAEIYPDSRASKCLQSIARKLCKLHPEFSESGSLKFFWKSIVDKGRG